MQSALDIGAFQLELLKSLEPAVVSETIFAFVQSFAKPAALAVVLWDPDFEEFSDNHQYLFGASSAQLEEALPELLKEHGEFDSTSTTQTVSCSSGKVLLHKVVADEEPVAVILITADAELAPDQLAANLAQVPIDIALRNAFEMSEMKKEVERLREQYEQLESDLYEERRMAALNGATTLGGSSPATFRLEQSDKEKLVYEISNTVRSSLDVQEVLQTAVTKIGSTFKLSRCLVIWPMPESQEYSVYEYHDENVPPSQSIFFTPAGETFVRLASQKTAPHDFSDDSEQAAFDRQFLNQFGFLSGMLVPLIYQDRNIGSLFLQDCMTPREWSIDNTALIGSLADLVTVAIEHANMHEEKKRQAVTDGLTGISNRRHFNEVFDREFERARRYGDELSLVLVDMDFLKKINDTYGHHVGDMAIKTIGSVLNKSCRAVDLAARYGGEEFCLLLPDTGLPDASNLAERVRKLIEQTPVEGPGSISASIGVATYPAHANSPDELFEAADQALYAAKQGGRNRVVTADTLPAKA